MIVDPGAQVAQRRVSFPSPSGEMVDADERYFLIRVAEPAISSACWTDLEREVMAAHHWWTRRELDSTLEQIWPENLVGILIDAGAWPILS